MAKFEITARFFEAKQVQKQHENVNFRVLAIFDKMKIGPKALLTTIQSLAGKAMTAKVFKATKTYVYSTQAMNIFKGLRVMGNLRGIISISNRISNSILFLLTEP